MSEDNKVAFNQNDAKVLYSQAYGYYNSGLYHKAKDCFRLLTALFPNDHKYWYGLGATLQMLRDYEDAIQAYSLGALVDLDEQDPAPHLHAAECFMAIRKYEKATIALDSAETIVKKHNLNQKLIDQIAQLREAIQEVVATR